MNRLIQLKKKAIPPSPNLLRGAFYLLLLVTVCVIPFALAQRNATSQGMTKLGSVSKGPVGIGNSLPATIIVVTNTNDGGASSSRDALAMANDSSLCRARMRVIVASQPAFVLTYPVLPWHEGVLQELQRRSGREPAHLRRAHWQHSRSSRVLALPLFST